MSASTVRVKVRFFGPLRESAGVDGFVREVADGGSVGDLMEVLRGEVALPKRLLAVSAVAVNQEYVGLERVLIDGDEVAILPPVSGGAE